MQLFFFQPSFFIYTLQIMCGNRRFFAFAHLFSFRVRPWWEALNVPRARQQFKCFANLSPVNLLDTTLDPTACQVQNQTARVWILNFFMAQPYASPCFTFLVHEIIRKMILFNSQVSYTLNERRRVRCLVQCLAHRQSSGGVQLLVLCLRGGSYQQVGVCLSDVLR